MSAATLSVPETPTDAQLHAGLLPLLRNGDRHARLQILARHSLHEGTFPGERIDYRIGAGRAAAAYCKYSADRNNAAYGHRGGPAYEAEVYQKLLSRSSLTLCRYRGRHRSKSSGGVWLILDFLNGCNRIHLTTDPTSAVCKAASWAGRFHREQAQRLKRLPTFLNRYDAAWYAGWARRTCEFAGPLHQRFPWLRGLCATFESLIPELTESHQTLVHGEYYPKNVLLYRNAIYPVDWESAAMGLGEIDLASLTEGWPRAVTELCEGAYLRERWAKKQPPDAQRRIWLARLYLHLRWLGDRPDWTQRKSSLWHFRQLRVAARKLGINLA